MISFLNCELKKRRFRSVRFLKCNNNTLYSLNIFFFLHIVSFLYVLCTFKFCLNICSFMQHAALYGIYVVVDFINLL